MKSKLFSKTRLGSIELKNHLVMAPMTRSRALKNVPNDLMAEYYAQRAEAGLIVTEGTSPSPNGLGYARIPGIFSTEHVAGWKKVTSAVHARNGRIFVQLMHTGRISHPANLPIGAVTMGPSSIQAKGQMWTDSQGMQDFPVPQEMSLEDIRQAKAEYVQAAKNAVEAGFDGVELHGANGYLLDQFLNPDSNQRNDLYGGDSQNRCRFVLEVAAAVSEAIGKARTGIRLSPYGAANGMGLFSEIETQYSYLAGELNSLGLVYIHLVDHSSMGAPKVEPTTVQKIRKNFKNSLILSGGYTRQRAEADLETGTADLIAIGKGFLANPDLVSRLEKNAELNPVSMETFYTADAKGYTDYPTLS